MKYIASIKRQHEVSEEIEGISGWVSIKKIEENDFNFDIAKCYVQNLLEEETIIVKETLKDFKQELADLERVADELETLLTKERY